jgi:hypothetical protein
MGHLKIREETREGKQRQLPQDAAPVLINQSKKTKQNQKNLIIHRG